MGMGFDAFADHFWAFAAVLVQAAGMTLIVTAGGGIVAILLGLVFVVMKTLPNRVLNRLATLYVDIVRATPTLTLLFIIYFGLPQLGIRLAAVPAAIIGFGIHGGAYVTEIFRAGLQAVDRGQSEAGFAIGMTRLASIRYVVMPQAARISLPPLCNFMTLLLKDSSIASTIAVPELMSQAKMLSNQTYLTDQIFLFAAAIYLVMSLPLSYGIKRIELKLGRRYLTQ